MIKNAYEFRQFSWPAQNVINNWVIL